MNSENPTPAPIAPEPSQIPTVPKRRLNLLLFFAALFAPPVLTFLSAYSKLEGSSIALALVGSGIGGIACGVMLGRRLGSTTASRVMLSIMFTLIFAVVCFVMSFMGCMAGGFKINMH